jgi:hypothetical protein
METSTLLSDTGHTSGYKSVLTGLNVEKCKPKSCDREDNWLKAVFFMNIYAIAESGTNVMWKDMQGKGLTLLDYAIVRNMFVLVLAVI